MASVMGSMTCNRPAALFRTRPWDAAQPAWQLAMEHDARREHPGAIKMSLDRRWSEPGHPAVLTYRHTGLVVPGRVDRVPVVVQFHEFPDYDCYGLHPLDYPRVFADPRAQSKHRMPDDALCLFFPHDLPWKRWRRGDGLGCLLRLTATHLFNEEWWRDEGGQEDSEWPGPEAEHGFAHERRPHHPARSHGRHRRRRHARVQAPR